MGFVNKHVAKIRTVAHRLQRMAGACHMLGFNTLADGLEANAHLLEQACDELLSIYTADVRAMVEAK